MRGVVFLLLASLCGVAGRLHSEFLEVSSLLKSQAKDFFPSELEFIQKAHEFQTGVHDPVSNAKFSTQPMVLRYGDSCDSDCHDFMVKRFGEGAVSHLTNQFAIVATSVSELEIITALNPNMLKYYMAMLPEMKVHAALSAMAGFKGLDCLAPTEHMTTHHAARKERNIIKTPSTITLRVIVNPLQEHEFNGFHSFVQTLEREKGLISSTFSKHVDGQQRILEVTLSSCEQVRAIAHAYAARREVLWIERVYPAYTHNRWANGVCDSGDASSRPLETNSIANFTGRGDIISVTDTGIDMKNCYFRDEEVPTPYVWSDEASAATINLNHRKVVQYYRLRKSATEITDGIDDSVGHGTHVAGIVAGRTAPSYGDYKTYGGMAQDAKIAFFDIGDVNSSVHGGPGLITPTNLNTGLFSIVYLSGARIFTNSWGTATNEYDTNAQKVDEFMWTHKDALVLFSAGNTGEFGANTVGSPATFKNGLCVGATLNDHDSWLYYEGETDDAYGIDAVAGFSSHGPTRDNRLKPDVLAPGYWTTSAAGNFNSSENFCALRAMRGTSMACPTAAAFALKIRRYFLDGFYPSGVRTEADAFTPSGALLKAMLVHSSRKMLYVVDRDTHAVSDISGTYPSTIQGYGRIDMSKILNFGESAASPISLFVIGAAFSTDPHYAQFASIGTQTYTFTTTSDTSPIRITMCYTDKESSPLAASAINGEAMENVLTVQVSSAAGTVTPYLAPGVVRDNTQVIDLTNPAAFTTYTVTVACTTLISGQGPQPYALVITGKITYLEDGEAVTYSVPADNFTATGGALKYILALGLLTLFLGALVYHFRRIVNKKSSMMLDPSSFEATDDFYEEDVQDTGRGGKKSVFATIRNIRSNHRKAQQQRQMQQQQQQTDVEGYYE